MKKNIWVVVSVLLFVSCRKESASSFPDADTTLNDEIVFSIRTEGPMATKAGTSKPEIQYGMLRPVETKAGERHSGFYGTFKCTSEPMEEVTAADILTKTTEVASLSSFYAAATTGSAGSETSVWNNASFSGSANYTGGKYWPATTTSYNFYASNVSMTFAAAGTTVAATNATDVVYAYAPTAAYKTKNTLTFNHVFGRIGTVTVTPDDGFDSSDITDVSITVTPKTGGTYNLRTGAWSSVTTGSATAIANTTPGTKSNGLCMVPGEYTVSGSWKATGKSYSATGKVTIVAGRQMNFNIVLGGELMVLPGEFPVSATKKVRFARGNLQATIGSGPTNTYNYTASAWNIADTQYDCVRYGSDTYTFAAGLTVDLFGWVGASASYDTYGLCTNTAINNAYYGTSDSDGIKTDWGSIPGVVSLAGSGFRTLTASEWTYLCDSNYSSATVNGESNARFTQATINTDGASVYGLILFPDDVTIASGEATTWGAINGGSSWRTKCTTAQWLALESKGCVFLPAAGSRNGNSASSRESGVYYSAICYTNSAAYTLSFGGSIAPTVDFTVRYIGCSVRLVKDAD